MGTKYSSNSASGYNATPPADDGTVSEANKGKWSTIKTKLADPVKDLADTINSELVTHFDNGPVAYTANQTLGTGHYGQYVQVSGSGVTLTLTDANTLGAGWNCEIVSTDTTNTVTIDRATASNTINETTANISLLPLQTVKAVVNAAATGFLVESNRRTNKINRVSEEVLLSGKSIWLAEGANVASASSCNIWLTDGNTRHITGTTTINDFATAPQAGAIMHCIADGAFTIADSATIVVPGNVNLTVGVDDTFDVYAETTTTFRITNYQSTTNTNIQTFTSSGTWTKPSVPATSRVLIELWGGGGSGGRSGGANSGGGGGGGGYSRLETVLSALGATETVTIGAGGAAQTSNTNGNAGTNSTFGSLLTAYAGGGGGGAGATDCAGGGGAGEFAAGASAVDAAAGAGGTGIAGTSGGTGGTATNAGTVAQNYFSGGGGGGASGVGGKAYYGGGGGAGGGSGTGGTSVNGGAGGAQAVAGTQPSGGGGGGSNVNSGAGAAGKCVVTVYPG